MNLPISPTLNRVTNPALQRVSRWMAASVVVMLAACVVTMFARAWRYDAAAEALVQEQEELFRETFPGQTVPVGIWRRMQSERRQLAGTHGDAAPEMLDITPLFQGWLSAMPAEGRYQIDQVDLRSDQLDRLSGSAKSFADVQLVADGLKAAGFSVRPASTSQSGGRVTLRFESLPFAPDKKEIRETLPIEEALP